MRHSVAARTPPRALGVNFLGFVRQASTAISFPSAPELAERPSKMRYAHGFLGHWSLPQVVPTLPVRFTLASSAAALVATRPRRGLRRPRMHGRLLFREHGRSC